MNLEWLQDDNNDSGNHCDHILASFLTSKNQTLNDIKNPYTAVECSDNIERIFKAIAEKNLDKVKEIVNQHQQRCQNFGGDPDFKWDIVNDLSKNWSPLHYSVFQGCDKIFLWFLSVGGDIEQITYDGYSCLILAVMANHPNMVSLLIAQSNLNINHVSRKGSALHIAALQNNQIILKMLLKHPNINLNIYNTDQLRAIDVASGKAKEIIQEELQLRTETQQALLISSFISSMKMMTSNLNTFIANQPKKPPIYKGYVQKLHYSRLYMYLRYIIVDPDNGVLARYEDISQVPLNPKEIISLAEINNLQIQKHTWFSKSNNTYLLVEYGEQKIYFSFTSETIAKIWFDFIKLAVGYTKYVQFKLDQYNFSKEENKLQATVNQLLMENANQQIEVRDTYLPSEMKFESQHIQSTQYKDEKLKHQPSLQSFKDFKVIGKGSFGFVFKVKSFENSKIYALKQQNKQQLKRLSQFDYAINELKLMKKLNHPFIIDICCAFQSKISLYYLMEYQEKGDLSLYIGKGNMLSENHSKLLIAQVVLAIEYLHKFDIVYRDLKPQNIIVGNDGYLKLVDLGLAKQIQNDRSAFSFCGSPAYLAPETIIGNGVNKSVDIYGIGLLLYEMLSGHPPHFINNIEVLLDRIKYSSISYDNIDQISNSAKKLLKLLLQKDNYKRPTITQVKDHIFFADIDWQKLFEKTMILPKLILKNEQPEIFYSLDQELEEEVEFKQEDTYVEGWDFY